MASGLIPDEIHASEAPKNTMIRRFLANTAWATVLVIFLPVWPARRRLARKVEPRRSTRLNFHGINFPGDLSVWTAVVFLVVLAILGKYAWGPISDGLQMRRHEIAGQIAEAHRKNEEARQTPGRL